MSAVVDCYSETNVRARVADDLVQKARVMLRIWQ